MTSEGSVSMNIDSNREKESLNEDKAIHYVVLHEGQNLLKDNVLKVETIDNIGNDVTAQGQGILQVQQQLKPQGTVVCWERLLHVRSIRVLLVENDDSTRHVVTALLRNCNYEVVEASNGLQAWKILEDLTNHIDLVLTEVVIPCVSGIGLLCKITSHETRKNIPVVMMSSHDSMRLVVKCLSKGAVDFLVKPIRKNELKNLWQHVWRRCHSSSGSGSESGTQTRKPVKSKSRDKFDNSGSYDGGNNESNGLDVCDGSDDGSDAQSSWTKVEVGGSQAMSPADHLAECPDSSCAQDTFSNAGTAAYKMIPVHRAKA
ncbi:Two-component response regulator-like APRR7 [Forsythia ovata]|uniref:Two-component response regulator-like APRR7 n=1 Tax=Forsythia ovata TaxID=205694 RepID=A0ABD1WXP1_9LAMI